MSRQKLIGIDARLYFQTGVGVYIRNFLHYLQLQAPDTYRFNVYILEKDSDQIHFSNPHFIKREVNSRWHSISEQIAFNRVLLNDKLDLMHFTYFSYPIRYSRPFIATVHDVTPLLFKTGKASTLPAFVYGFKHAVFSYVIKQQVHRSRAIITPTNTVKKQLIEIYGNTIKDKISVLYEGVNHEFFEVKENNALKKQFSRPFFLYVGNFYPHKNVDRLIEGFRLLGRDDIDLVLAGPSNYFSGNLEKLILDSKATNIKLFHPSNSEDLLFLYRNSLALINPSLSEGFGLPIIEAAYCGTPVIASDIDVFKEILGEQYYSFDPSRVDSMRETLKVFLSIKHPKEPILHNKFSFERMAEQYLQLLRELM